MVEKRKYLKQKEVCELLGVKRETLNIWRCVQRHNIPYTKIGGIILYPEDLLYEWLDNKTKPSNYR